METLVKEYIAESDEEKSEALRDRLILLHMPMVRKIAKDQAVPQCPYDELCALGYYELVAACTRAKTALTDTNITPYVLRNVRLRMIRYKSLLSLIVVKQTSVWKPTFTKVRRELLKDIKDPHGTIGLGLDLRELIEANTHTFHERMIIVYILYGHSVGHVAKLSGINWFTVNKLWNNFIKRIEHAF